MTVRRFALTAAIAALTGTHHGAVPARADLRPVALPRTGQTQCMFDPCDPLEDASVRRGVAWPVPRFSVGSAQSFVTDNLTGLMWTANLMGNAACDGTLAPCSGFNGRRTWQEALVGAALLNGEMSTPAFAGFTDWRLPTPNEIATLFNSGFGQGVDDNGNIEWLAQQGFRTRADPFAFWTATTVESSPDRALRYNPQLGNFGWAVKSAADTGSIYVRTSTLEPLAEVPQTGQTGCWDTAGTPIACASTGQDGEARAGAPWTTGERFVLGSGAETGCVTDALTGLMWPRSVPDLHELWLDALAVADEFELCGHDDWRLPNFRELTSLVDWKSSSPSLPPGHPFQNVNFVFLCTGADDWFWSSTPFQWYLDGDDALAHGVSMEQGQTAPCAGFGLQAEIDHSAVWPVRTAYTVAPSAAPTGPVRYVDVGAAPDGDGTSWASAFDDLQNALAVAVDGDEIWVVAGTYRPTAGSDRTIAFGLPHGVEVYGGFAGSETVREQRDWRAYPTILSGDIGGLGNSADNSYHVVSALLDEADRSTVLDGFVITGGRADHASAPLLRQGGGVFVSFFAASFTLANLLIVDNYAADAGGGMARFASPGSPLLYNVAFVANSTGGSGGGLSLGPPTGDILEPIERQGGFTEAHLVDVVFSGNTASFGGGAAIHSWARLDNVTVAGNSAAQEGGGLYFTSVAVPNLAWERQLSNVVIWGNRANGSTTSASASLFLDDDGAGTTQPATIAHSLIANSGGSGAGWARAMGGDGGDNLDIDPLFAQPVDPALAPTQAGNLRLLTGSPAIDVGDDEAALNFPLDLDLGPRIVNGIVDLGAYEWTTLAFSDGFELGSTARWSVTQPAP